MGRSIDELEKIVERLSTELHAAEVRLREARVEASGVSLGEIVIGTSKRRPGRYRVCAVEPHYEKAWLRANPEKKDGSFGKNVVNLFDDWMKPPTAENSDDRH